MSFTTWNRRWAVLTVFTLAVALVNCSSGSSSILDANPDDSLFLSDLSGVAVKTDELTQHAIAGPLAAMQGTSLSSSEPERPNSIDSSFERAMPCPAGGEIVLSGQFNGSFDREARALDMIGSGDRTATDCSFDRGERSLTIDGSSNWEMVRRWVYGLSDGMQTRRYFGSWTVTTDEGQVRSCTFDYTLSFDPATGSVSADGEMCDSPIPGGANWLKDVGA